MAQEEQHLSFEQVLQELQIDRTQLNRLIREGVLKEQLVDGETKFSMSDTQAAKALIEKRPTVVQDGAEAPSRTDIVGAADETADARSSKEPGTELLEEETAERETDILQEAPSAAAVDRDTEVLDEGQELELEAPEEEAPATPTALETELELEPTAEAAEKEEAEEDFFDFSAGLEEGELQLEEPEPIAGEAAIEEVPEEEEEIITDILDLESEEEVAEEDLLSEIMEIGEEEGIPVGDETEDLTAEITTMEEPTYEEGALDEVLDEEDEVDFGRLEGDEFEVPYAAPVAMGEGQVGGGWALLLVLTLIFMLLAGLFTVENAVSPDYSTGLTGWAPVGTAK